MSPVKGFDELLDEGRRLGRSYPQTIVWWFVAINNCCDGEGRGSGAAVSLEMMYSASPRTMMGVARGGDDDNV